MPDDQISSENNHEKDGRFILQAQGGKHRIDSTGARLVLIREYIKKNLKFIILWALINLLCYLTGLYIHGWKGVILWLVMSSASAWIGYKAVTKVRVEQRR